MPRRLGDGCRFAWASAATSPRVLYSAIIRLLPDGSNSRSFGVAENKAARIRGFCKETGMESC
jgi:hypothetical protein